MNRHGARHYSSSCCLRAMERCLRGVSIWKIHGIHPALSELAVTRMVGSQGIKWSKDERGSVGFDLKKTEFCGKEMIAESGKRAVKVLAGRPWGHEAGAEARGSHREGGALGVAQTW